jgi:hypothetical protein
MLGVALVLAFEDAQDMFQQNVLYVYVRVYACWCGPNPARLYVIGGVCTL